MRPLILVVEDDPTFQNLLSALFRGEGFEVDVASDGAEAVRLALERRPAAVVMDGSLPVLDGWSATAQIKAQNAHQCVVMLSAHSTPKHRRRAQDVGCDRFLSKPARIRDLLQAVRDCIAEKAEGAPE